MHSCEYGDDRQCNKINSAQKIRGLNMRRTRAVRNVADTHAIGARKLFLHHKVSL